MPTPSFSPSRAFPFLLVLAFLGGAPNLWATDLILDGTGVRGPTSAKLGGVLSYQNVTLVNGAVLTVTAFNGTDRTNTGNLVLKADTISIDATSSIVAKGAGYFTPLCRDGQGPNAFPLAGGRGGCAIRDSGGGGAHRGDGGRGTKDCSASGCIFPRDYEEDCGDEVDSSGMACISYMACSNSDGLPSVAGQAFRHSIYAIEFGASGGDKGCRDTDGFTPSAGTTIAKAGGSGGGRIVLVATNASQTGSLEIAGRLDANGNRGCANGNDSGGGGAGGSILLIGDTVTVRSTARISARGGRGGDSQPKCLTCLSNADCGIGQSCVNGRCSPCNCTPCTSTAQCLTDLGQTCKSLGGSFGNVCADSQNLCTPVPDGYEETECKGAQNSGTCDDCGGGGGGGILHILSRVSSVSPLAVLDVGGGRGGVCPICGADTEGQGGELLAQAAYVGEVCDGYDNTFSGTSDAALPALDCGGSSLPSCVAGLPQECPADLPACIGPVTDIRPRFLILVSTAATMLADAAGNPTFGDGSTEHPGLDTSADGDAANGNSSKLSALRGALAEVLAANPRADFALARFHQEVGQDRNCSAAYWNECQKAGYSYDDPTNNTPPSAPLVPGCDLATLYPGAGYPPSLDGPLALGWSNQADCINYMGSCGAPRRGADILVGFGKRVEQSLMWIDGKESAFSDDTSSGNHCNFAGGGDCELRASGPHPLSAALDAAADYLKPLLQCDGGRACRPYSVILVTDGVEDCAGNPVASAAALQAIVPDTAVPTYVVGLNIPPASQAQLNALAAAGKTSSAVFATDRDSLRAALADIVGSFKEKVERCNGQDDTCDGLTDEAFPELGTPCTDSGLGICQGTGSYVCNAAGDGTVCQVGTPGQAPTDEVCNGLDDNCDGRTDEGFPSLGQFCEEGQGLCHGTGLWVCTPGEGGPFCQITEPGQAPTDEVCNGQDDNCDGRTDEGALCPNGQSCVSGVCTPDPADGDADEAEADGADGDSSDTQDSDTNETATEGTDDDPGPADGDSDSFDTDTRLSKKGSGCSGTADGSRNAGASLLLLLAVFGAALRRRV